MAIQPVSIPPQPKIANVTKNASVDTPDTTKKASDAGAVIYEKTDQTNVTTKKTYTKDTVALNEINQQVETKLASLRATVENLISMQSVKNGEAQGLSYDQILKKYDGKLKEFYQNLEVDESTRLSAQQEISEDGFWGVKQTAQRTIEFAKALSGGDPSKITLLKRAIEEGYEAAEKAWGGGLPEICKQTQEAIMKGLDEWAKEAS
ncbi:MAG: hypothetical protein H7X79_07165 [Sporomusaceae bacterium]|nr:hypothetical protein [Sporomusaceae bacterium]